MSKLTKQIGVASLALVLAFSAACSRKADQKPAAPDPVPMTQVYTPPQPEPEAVPEEAPAPEPTAPAINMAPASAYLNALIGQLKTAGYAGHQSLDPAAVKAEADGTDDESKPDPAATARNAFTGINRTLHNLFVNTPAVYRGFIDENAQDKSWIQQVTVLGDIRYTLPGEKQDDGTVTPARYYGNLLNITVSSDDDAKNINDVKISVFEGWGYTDGKTIAAGSTADMPDEDYAKFFGLDDDNTTAPDPVSKGFTWHERAQAQGAVTDWIRDNTGNGAAKAKPAAEKIASSWQEPATEQSSGYTSSYNTASSTQMSSSSSSSVTHPPESKLCVGVCSGPHINLSTGKVEVFSTGPGLKF